MFGKKYIFETSHTRYRRYVFNIFILLLLLTLCYVAFSLYLLYAGYQETKLAQDTFYQKSPDLIVVFTGDTGRIPLAIELSKKFETTKIFITGVDARNTVDRLLKVTGKHNDPNVDSHQIEIDYLARNTVENVLSTLRFLRERKEFQKILLVSSNYHIYRIKRITKTLRDRKDDFKFYFHGTTTDLKQIRSYKLLLKETYKIVKALAFLMLWSEDQEGTWPTQSPLSK